MMAQKKPVILLIEDDRTLVEMYVQRLKHEGFEVLTAFDGNEGVQMALESGPNLILLDLMLPKQGGLSVLKIIKSNEMTKNIPVIVLTNFGKEEYREESLRDGAVMFLLKAESMPGQVVEKVKETLGMNG
jgi:DNA-binding response OmpR family regulator